MRGLGLGLLTVTLTSLEKAILKGGPDGLTLGLPFFLSSSRRPLDPDVLGSPRSHHFPGSEDSDAEPGSSESLREHTDPEQLYPFRCSGCQASAPAARPWEAELRWPGRGRAVGVALGASTQEGHAAERALERLLVAHGGLRVPGAYGGGHPRGSSDCPRVVPV